MKMPFTVPRLPELDALSLENRTSVLRCYASSDDARGILKRTKIGLIVGLGFAILGMVAPEITDAAPSGQVFVKAITTGFWLTAALAWLISIVSYRMASSRVIRSIIDKEIRRP